MLGASTAACNGESRSKFRERLSELYTPRREAKNRAHDSPRHHHNHNHYYDHSTAAAMRGKRSKAYKKLMGAYHQTFGFREPYQVLRAHSLTLHVSLPQPTDP